MLSRTRSSSDQVGVNTSGSFTPVLYYPEFFSYEYFLNTFAPWIHTWGLKPDPEPKKFENLIWIQAKTTEKTAYESETLTAFR